MKKSKKTDWRGLILLSQLGISIMVPPVISLMAAKWLCERFSLGSWVYFAAVVLGIGSAYTSAVDLVRPLLRPINNEDDGEL